MVLCVPTASPNGQQMELCALTPSQHGRHVLTSSTRTKADLPHVAAAGPVNAGSAAADPVCQAAAAPAGLGGPGNSEHASTHMVMT
eukprot:1143893-Pelagomonas_calceolata.AAC.1